MGARRPTLPYNFILEGAHLCVRPNWGDTQVPPYKNHLIDLRDKKEARSICCLFNRLG
jgi:hypothetical protein